MSSNDRPESRGFSSTGTGSRAAANEETLKTEKLQIERKSFAFALKENPRGRFLRITEDVGGRRNRIDTVLVRRVSRADERAEARDTQAAGT